MNTHDKYELPPLPWPHPQYGTYSEEALENYARAAIEPYAKRIAELEAARIAYASEFESDENGEPDVGRIHENIRKLKADRLKNGGNDSDYRQRRGEPVAYIRTISFENGEVQRDLVWVSEAGDLSRYRDFVSFEPLCLVAQQPAEPKIAGFDRLRRAAATQEAKDGIGALDALYDLAVKHGASKTAAAGFAHVANGAFATLEGIAHDEIRLRLLAAQTAQPAEPDWSAINTIIAEQFGDDTAGAARAQSVVAAVLRERPAATIDPTDPGYDVNVLREHVRHLERRVQQLSKPAEPVKVSSDKEILTLAATWPSMLDDYRYELVLFARALLARYGQPAASAEPPLYPGFDWMKWHHETHTVTPAEAAREWLRRTAPVAAQTQPSHKDVLESAAKAIETLQTYEDYVDEVFRNETIAHCAMVVRDMINNFK